MTSLDKRIKKYYADKKLSDAKLKTIVHGKQVGNAPRRIFKRYAAVAMLIAGLCFIFLIHLVIKENNITKSYAKEIVKNHLKQSPMNVITDDAKVLANALPKLNFDVSYDSRLASFGKLVGGKYCHVDDQIAAQLKIITSTDEALTCYQFKQRHNISFDKIVSIEGTDVHMWTQGQVVFAVAKDE